MPSCFNTPPTRTGGAEFSSFAKERRSTLPPRTRARRTRKTVPLQKTIPLQKKDHTAPALMPTGNIEKRDSVRIKVLNEGGWEIGKRETR